MSSSKYVVAKQVDFGKWEYLKEGYFIPEMSVIRVWSNSFPVMVSFTPSIESAAKFDEDKALKITKVLRYRTDGQYKVERYIPESHFV